MRKNQKFQIGDRIWMELPGTDRNIFGTICEDIPYAYNHDTSDGNLYTVRWDIGATTYFEREHRLNKI